MNYTRLIVAILAIGAVVHAVSAADVSTTPNAAVLATINTALGAAQSGDVDLLRKQYTPASTFVDEFQPYFWSGSNSLDEYFASATEMYKATKMGETKLSHGKPKYIYVAAHSAYVVMPISVRARANGKPYRAAGTLVFALQESDQGWKIRSQSWSKSSENIDPY